MPFRIISFAAALAFGAAALPLRAQSRVGADSSTRVSRFVRDMGYGTLEGLGFAGLDQLRDEPVEWQRGWSGYGQRVASNLGEFYIQEVVTEGLAAVMNHPLDYVPCGCRSTLGRVGWAARGMVVDEKGGGGTLAIPRIVGAYAGSFAQAQWRPAVGSRATIALVNGTTSLAIGGVINLYHEFAPWSKSNRCRRAGASRCGGRR